MPRGYSYDHFQVPKREPRERATPPDMLKAATAKKGDAVPLAESQEGLHYGRKNAETLKRLKTRAQKRPAQGARKGAMAKAPARGAKALGRVAAAAKKGLQRVARKTTARKAPKKR
jgi:hypothetical protein